MLSKRLSAVLAMIDINDNLVDVGCDHGYLAKEALNKGIKMVQLVDNKIGPLNVAKKNLSSYDCKRVEFTLASGLSKILPFVNCAAICGMGGDLISTIINNDLDAAKKLSYLVLEANTKVETLRKFISDNSFEILNEAVVFEKSKFYQIIKIRYNENAKKLSDKEIMFGKEFDKSTIEYKEFLRYKYQLLSDIISKINTCDDNYKQTIYKMKILEELINETKRNY